MAFEKRNGYSKKIVAMILAAIIITVAIVALVWYWRNNNENDNVNGQYARYRFVYTLVLTSDIAGEIQLNCTIPTDSPNFQTIQSVNCSVNPSWTIIDEHNNEIFHFRVSLVPGKTSEVSIMVLVELNKTLCPLPSNSASYNITSPIFQEYTKSEKYVESDDPLIMEVAQNITKGCSDPLNASIAICTWVNQNLDYSGFSDPARGALWALRNENGDCSEYSDLFIALCRARGIPARLMDGIALWLVDSSGTQSWEKIGHDWAEVYFQNIGWVWVDPTTGDFACSDGNRLAIQLGQYCSSLSGGYRYCFTGNANATERFALNLQVE